MWGKATKVGILQYSTSVYIVIVSEMDKRGEACITYAVCSNTTESPACPTAEPPPCHAAEPPACPTAEPPRHHTTEPPPRLRHLMVISSIMHENKKLQQ